MLYSKFREDQSVNGFYLRLDFKISHCPQATNKSLYQPMSTWRTQQRPQTRGHQSCVTPSRAHAWEELVMTAHSILGLLLLLRGMLFLVSSLVHHHNHQPNFFLAMLVHNQPFYLFTNFCSHAIKKDVRKEIIYNIYCPA